MKLLVKGFVAAAFLAVSLAAFGSVAIAQETDDPAKIEIYKRFVDNRLPNPTARVSSGARLFNEVHQRQRSIH